MNKNIKELNPQSVWSHFAEICAIPHPSRHEDAIREYIVNFAAKNNIEHLVDQAGNVIMRKPATPGMERRKGIILQAHLDMVPQKNSDKVFDFEKDAIQAYVDGEWVTAEGTTLGADNGMGMAAILAVFESKSIVHGSIEALITASEEVGMDGAFGLKGGLLKGDILVNLDSETEGELYVGCAGGLDANISIKYTPVATPAKSEYKALRIEVKGLKGGHSGLEIILERGNANKILNRLMYETLEKFGLLLANIDGGGLRNAIPREAVATVLIPVANSGEFANEVKLFEKKILAELKGVDDGVTVRCSEVEMPAKMIDSCTTKRLIYSVYGAPNGVISMSRSMKGIVQTSTNLARVVSTEKSIDITCLLRSSSNSEKENLGAMMKCVFELAGAEVELTGSYDGWNPNMDSPILKTMIASYEKLFGKTPIITSIHAGLECGIISTNYPNLDMISFGPTICYPHSPDEKVEIESVAKFWNYLLATLEGAPSK